LHRSHRSAAGIPRPKWQAGARRSLIQAWGLGVVQSSRKTSKYKGKKRGLVGAALGTTSGKELGIARRLETLHNDGLGPGEGRRERNGRRRLQVTKPSNRSQGSGSRSQNGEPATKPATARSRSNAAAAAPALICNLLLLNHL